jgi:hypothetical protein
LYLDDLNIDLKSFEETELDQLQGYSVQVSVQPEVVGCVQENVQAEVAQPEVVGCVQASVQPEVAQNAVSYSSAVCSQLVIQGPVEIDAKSLGGKLVLGPGFHDEPDPELLAASLGDDKPRSHVNDGWALRQADQLRQKLNWDMSIPLGNLPFKQLNLLFSRLLATSVRKDGRAYPSETLMNMLNCLSQILKRASELKAIEGRGQALESGFNIKKSHEFPKTRSTVSAAVKKSAREGLNKKRLKVYRLTIAMETAILADVDHQMTNSVGCQKHLAFYIMCRLGIRGGVELWSMERTDLKLIESPSGKEYIV